MKADLHWALMSLVLIFWLKPCFDFGFRLFIFLILLILFSFVSHAALHGTWLRTPTHPSLLTRLFHHSPHPWPSFHCNPLPDSSSPPTTAAAPTPEQTAVSDRRGAWEVQPTRQANSSYLTSHLAADRHGGSVQVYTPHLINQHPFTQSLWSQICLMRLKSARIKCLILSSLYFVFRSSLILLADINLWLHVQHVWILAVILGSQ